MDNPRHVMKLLSVFDLPDRGTPGPLKAPPTRIMLFYDERENRKEFKILNRNITRDESLVIEAWLKENVDPLNLFADPCGHVTLAGPSCDLS